MECQRSTQFPTFYGFRHLNAKLLGFFEMYFSTKDVTENIVIFSLNVKQVITYCLNANINKLVLI